MTDLLFHSDAYIKEFEATVTNVTNDGIILDRTAFYIGGGGQPNDIGVIKWDDMEFSVTKVGRSGNDIYHKIDGPTPPIGQSVAGFINWDRRYLLMRTHTALHILCGVVWRDYGAKVTGGDMQPGSARMDFELESISSQFAQDIESSVNAEISQNRPIIVGNLTRQEADIHPDLIRTKINLLPQNITEVRTIDITGLDVQADGGTHVSNTKEVGKIKVVGHESKGRINKRIRITIEDEAA
tara:strand:- start:637 stop:1356 length:720 start_codon:yes stop_codon:yes gene_type:complete